MSLNSEINCKLKTLKTTPCPSLGSSKEPTNQSGKDSSVSSMYHDPAEKSQITEPDPNPGKGTHPKKTEGLFT